MKWSVVYGLQFRVNIALALASHHMAFVRPGQLMNYNPAVMSSRTTQLPMRRPLFRGPSPHLSSLQLPPYQLPGRPAIITQAEWHVKCHYCPFWLWLRMYVRIYAINGPCTGLHSTLKNISSQRRIKSRIKWNNTMFMIYKNTTVRK